VQRQATGSANGAVVRNHGLVDVGKQTLTVRRAVAGGSKVQQTAQPVLNRSRLGVHRFRVESLLKLLIRLGGLVESLAAAAEIIVTDEGGGVDIGEAEHLKRNLRLLAEPHQLKHLKERVRHPLRHTTGEVKQEHDAVVLAVLLHDLADEQVIVGAVLMEAVKVQHPGLLGTLTPNLVRCLAAVELRSQLTDERIGVLDELAVVRQVKRVALVVVLKLLKDHIGLDDDAVKVLDDGDRDGRAVVDLAILLADAVHEVGHAVTQDLLPLAVLLRTTRLLLLHLLTDALHGGVVVQAHGDLVDLRESLNGVDHVHELLLVRAERNIHEPRRAPLEVEVEAVDERGVGNVHLGEAEQVGVDDLLVAQEEVAASAGVLLLHQLLNADILNDIGNALKEHLVVALLLCFSEDRLALLVGSPQGVADLMGDQHGLHGFRHLPNGHDEVTLLHIEGSGFSRGVEGERKVLGGESAGEDGERTVHARIVTDEGGWVKR